MENPREFFETLETRVDPAKAAGLTATYRFEIDGAGTWTVDVDDGKVSVSENGGDVDCTITTSSETFMKIANGEQNPTAAYMSGKLKVKGDMGHAMRLVAVALLALTLGSGTRAARPRALHRRHLRRLLDRRPDAPLTSARSRSTHRRLDRERGRLERARAARPSAAAGHLFPSPYYAG